MSSFYSLLSSNWENEQPDDSLMEIAYYLNLDEEHHETTTQQQSPSLLQTDGDCVSTSDTSSRSVGKKVSRKSGSKIAFKTKSDIDVLDDGYKWRKYGKKMVKNSPNPRNYYRCSSEGCCVKKRVEREQEDSSYVITTYEGVHDHPPPLATARHPVLQPFHAYPS